MLVHATTVERLTAVKTIHGYSYYTMATLYRVVDPAVNAV